MQIHFQEDDKLERTMLRIVKSLSTAEKRKTTWDDDGWGEILKELVQLSKDYVTFRGAAGCGKRVG